MSGDEGTVAQRGKRALGARVARSIDWHAAARTLREAGFFDQAWYLAHYPDVAASGIEPALHYVKYGARMGRDLGPEAPTSFWREVLPKLAGASTGEVLAHVATAGAGPVPGTVPYRAVLGALAWAAEGEGPGRGHRARGLAQAVLPAGQDHAAAIVDVNLAARNGNRASWARALSEYLAGQGLPPVGLSRASDNMLADLVFPELPTVETGPRVSVIMPAWNAQDSVSYAVRSILAQTWRPLELIVVDDASTDATPTILAEIAAVDPRMIVLRNEVNVGPYVSKNVGLMAARGDYITGHDADDLALPQRIERQVRFLQKGNHRYGFIGAMRMTADGEVTRLGTSGINAIDGVSQSAMISLMIEADLMRAIYGYWDTIRFGADGELARRIAIIEGAEIPRLQEVGLLMQDSPGGLTNHPEHGYSPGKFSPSRLAYRETSWAWHATIDSTSAYLPFPHEPRRFPAREDVLNAPGVVEQVIDGHRRSHADLFDRRIECDVCIITSLRYPGGNCSSTLDELRFLSESGLDVRLIHCASDDVLDPQKVFRRSERYDPWVDRIVPWYDVGHLRCRHLIVRHPFVVISTALSRLVGHIECERSHFVINNGTYRETGERLYHPSDLVHVAMRVQAGSRQIVPISPLVRLQIEGEIPADLLAPEDWSPTFNVADYAHPAKPALTAPFVIGRHARDAVEKWVEDPMALRAAYPASPDFEVSILGGAKHAAKLLDGLPANWRVVEFGSVPPKAFLDDLDVFAYFPHSERREAFGRTVVEAMIASRPVLLPPRFETTFGELAFYGQPHGVEAMVRALAADWEDARGWLAAVQGAAVARYASEAIAGRMPDLGVEVSVHGDPGPLSAELISFKQRIEAAGALAAGQASL